MGASWALERAWPVGAVTLSLLLSGCGGPTLTMVAVQETALVTGCWPDTPRYPTPVAVTVTADPALISETGALSFTATPLPTTTPMPRCTPIPGATAVVWPTPVPPPPPYPTMVSGRVGGGSGEYHALHLPEWVLQADLAVHPTAGWPAVAAVVWSGNDQPERVFVSVQSPETGWWGPATQVDLGESALGRYTRTAQIAITGNGTIHVVWGMSDPDFSDYDPPPRVWSAFSADYGRTWSQPQVIGEECRKTNDLAATPAGWLVVGLVCHRGLAAVESAIAVRSPEGIWSLERVAGEPWYFSDGAVGIVGDGDQAMATVLLLSGTASAEPLALLYQRRLASADPWALRSLPLSLGDPPLGMRMWHPKALVTNHPGQPATLSFIWSDATSGAVMVLHSPDGGTNWHPLSHVATGSEGTSATLGVDPLAQRLVAIWTCCHNTTAGSQHFVRWADANAQSWHDLQPNQTLPMLWGARQSGVVVSGQAQQSSQLWLAWLEGRATVAVRAVDLANILPVCTTPGGCP